MARQSRVGGRIIAALALLAILGVPVAWKQLQPPPPVIPLDRTTCEVYFSPDGGCTEAIVRTLDGAQSTVLVQAYSFTSAPIAKALTAAHKRGVAVQVILDKSQRNAHYTSATFLAHAGIPTFIDAAHAIAHNKVMVIDGPHRHHRLLQLHPRRGREKRGKPAHPARRHTGQTLRR